jgi:hypothetical protein
MELQLPKWLTNPSGRLDDDHQMTLEQFEHRFDSLDVPVQYSGQLAVEAAAEVPAQDFSLHEQMQLDQI